MSKADWRKAEKRAPVFTFLCGMIVLPAFLLQRSMLIKVILAVIFILYAAALHKKISVHVIVLVTGGIILANLLSPIGRVMVSIGSLPITAGALKQGVYKAATLIGLIYLSRWAIHEQLKIPGRWGGVFGRILFYFERITIIWSEHRGVGLIARLDRTLLEVSDPGEETRRDSNAGDKPERGEKRGLDLRARMFLAGAIGVISLAAFVLSLLISIY